MKKRFALTVITAVVAMLLCSCISVTIPAVKTADVNQPTVPR